MLRKFTYMEEYPEIQKTQAAQPKFMRSHLGMIWSFCQSCISVNSHPLADHCIEMIRQNLMCVADVGVISWVLPVLIESLEFMINWLDMTGYLDGRCLFPTSTHTTSAETSMLSSIGSRLIKFMFQKIICNVKDSDMSSTCLSRRSDMMMMTVAPWKRGFLAVINSRFFSPVFTSLVKIWQI